MSLWEAYEELEEGNKGEDEPELDDFDDDFDWDEEDEVIPVCPECGSDDLTITGEDSEGNNEYECEDCGERFADGEDED